MTRVLVTGAGGFVGGHLVTSILASTDWHVITLDSFRHNGGTDGLYDILRSYSDRTTTVTHDLTVPFSPRQRHTIGEVDYVLDVASRSSVDESIANPMPFILNNVAVTLTTLELARDLDVRRYVHLSTDEIYGSTHITSLTDHRPSSPYAASKAAQEDVCHAYARTYDVPVTVITSANMFGERQSQLAFIPKIIRATLHDEPIVVHTYAGGTPGKRHYSYVGDVTDWIANQLDDTTMLWSTHTSLAGRYLVDNLTLARDVSYLVNELSDDDHQSLIVRVDVADVRPGYDPHYLELPIDDHWLHPDSVAESPLLKRLQQTVEWFVAHPEWLEVR